MSGVPSEVIPRVRDHRFPSPTNMNYGLAARIRGARLTTPTPVWKAQGENYHVGASGRVSSISRWEEKEECSCRF